MKLPGHILEDILNLLLHPRDVINVELACKSLQEFVGETGVFWNKVICAALFINSNLFYDGILLFPMKKRVRCIKCILSKGYNPYLIEKYGVAYELLLNNTFNIFLKNSISISNVYELEGLLKRVIPEHHGSDLESVCDAVVCSLKRFKPRNKTSLSDRLEFLRRFNDDKYSLIVVAGVCVSNPISLGVSLIYDKFDGVTNTCYAQEIGVVECVKKNADNNVVIAARIHDDRKSEFFTEVLPTWSLYVMPTHRPINKIYSYCFLITAYNPANVRYIGTKIRIDTVFSQSTYYLR